MKKEHSTELSSRAKKKNWIDTYVDPLLMREVAVSESTLERLSEDIVQWALTDKEAIYVTEFYTSRGISSYVWYCWRNKYPKLQHAYDLAKEIIGVRQFKGVTKGKLKDSLIKSHIGYYSPEWVEESARVAKLAEPDSASIPVVVIDRVPESDIVPKLEGK